MSHDFGPVGDGILSQAALEISGDFGVSGAPSFGDACDVANDV